MRKLFEFFKTRPTTLMIAITLVLALVVNFYATALLNQSYAASLFPVPYYTAQLSFNPDQLKTWYAFLIAHNTLSTYITTQNIDFLFIVSTLFLHLFALLLISRLFPLGSKWRSAMVICALLSTLAPLADALENAVSYIMLANPLQFASFWAYIYSSFAAIKFAMFTFAYIAAAVGLLAGLVLFAKRALEHKSA